MTTYPDVYFPFGMLKSFDAAAGGTFTFSNNSSPVHDADEEIVDTYVTLPNQPFPVDMQGSAPAPWGAPAATWDYLLVAAYGITHAAAYVSVEAQYKSLRSFFRGGTGSYTGGTKGVLSVYQADQTSVLKCTARLAKMGLSLVSGKNTRYYIVPLTFLFFGDWHT